MIEMYASDLTHKKRASAIYRSLQLQKEWFNSGETIRILGQKGGNDYSYMMELEQGCVQDECWKYDLGVQMKSGNGPTTFDVTGMVSLNVSSIFEYGDILYTNTTPLTRVNTLDDGNIQIPMNGNDFYMFGYNAGAAETVQWNSNNAIFFGSITTIPAVNPLSLVSFGPTDGFRDTSSATGNGFVPTFGKYILLGNYDRRLTDFYRSQYTTLDSKYFISKFVAIFDDYFLYAQDSSGNLIQPTTPPPQGIFSVRLIRELIGQNRQWIEASVIESPPTPGYIADTSRSYPSGTYRAKDASGNTISPPSIYNNRPIDANGNLIEPTKISPYDICNGTSLLNICGTTFSSASPATGTSFMFQSDSQGNNWVFKNNAYLPI